MQYDVPVNAAKLEPVKLTTAPILPNVGLSDIVGAADAGEPRKGDDMVINDTRRSTLTTSLERRILKCKHAVLWRLPGTENI